MFYQIDTLFVRNRTTVLRRRVARNLQLGAVLGGGGASSRRRPMGVWGQSPQPPKTRGSGGGAPSARKFCIFLQK